MSWTEDCRRGSGGCRCEWDGCVVDVMEEADEAVEMEVMEARLEALDELGEAMALAGGAVL
jgi:hypothetical protein